MSEDSKIIPIEFARNFDDHIRRVKIDGMWYFSILDIFKHYGQSRNTSRDWSRVQERLKTQGFDILPKLVGYQFVGTDGKLKRPTPCVNFNTMLRIAQVTDFKHWEYLRQYMADRAEERIMSDAGMLESSDELGVPRLRGKKKRNRFSIAIDETFSGVISQKKLGQHIGRLTNITYAHVLGAFKEKLVERYQFTKTESRNFRDQFGKLTLMAIAYVEEAASFEMYGAGRGLSTFEQSRIVDQIAEDMANIFHKQCQRMGVDWLTNKPLLPDGSDTDPVA